MSSKNAVMKLPKILGLMLLLGVFFWSCEEGNGKAAGEKQNKLGVDSYLNDDQTLYTFYVDSFMRDNAMVFNMGNANDNDDMLMIPEVWSGVNVRWGFRRKPARSEQDTKIYWWQKSTVDVDTQNVYETQVTELKKAYFTPTALPAALMSEDSIEVYALLEVGGYRISRAYDLPADFKTRVLGSSVIEGMIVNGNAVRAGRIPSQVEGAAVFAIHKGSGSIFQGFSGENGRYRVTVSGKGEFSLVVLHSGFQPRILDKSIKTSISGVDITISELANGVRIEPEKLYELGAVSALSALNSGGYSVSGTAVDVSNGIVGIPGAFLVFYDRDQDEASFLQTDDAGSFSLSLPLEPSVQEDDSTALSVVGAAYGYAPLRGSEVIGAPNSAATLLGAVAFVEDGTINSKTQLTWGPRSTGGPSDFAKEPIKLHYPSGGIQAKMYLLAKGAFVPADVSVVWQIDGTVVAGENGMSAVLPLRSEKAYTVSAGFTDGHQEKVLLERTFDLDASYSADADAPVISFGDDIIRGGILDGKETDANGDENILIDPDNDNNPAVSITPNVKAIDPKTGTGEGLVYAWNVNDKPAGSGVSPNLPLEPGLNKVTLTVRPKDGGGSVTTTRMYLVGPKGTGGNGNGDGNGDGAGPTIPGENTGGGTISGNFLNVSFGYGSSGGIISSGNLGSNTNPLSYSTKGSNQFTVTLKALVSGPSVGVLTYAWSIHDVVTDALIADNVGATRTGQLEIFSLRPGSYAITATVTDSSNRSGKASRAFKIVAESAVRVPSGTKGEWLASSSGGAGDLPDVSDKTTFKDEGGKPVAVRVSVDVADPSGKMLIPMEWYVDGVLQEGIGSLDTLLQLPTGGGSSPVTRVVLGVGRGSGTNQEPVTMRRVFTLSPTATQSSLGPSVRWDTSSLDPAVIHNFNGSDPVQLILSVMAISSGNQVFKYTWTLNGSPVIGQTTKTAVLSLNRSGVNTVSVLVSNRDGTTKLMRDYKLNNLPVVSVSSDKSSAVVGDNIQFSASVSDVDSASIFTYRWKIKDSTSTLWESIPGFSSQPTTKTFRLPTSNLKADSYTVQVMVGDRGANVPAEAGFVLNASSGGPEIEWGASSLDPTKTHSFDSTTGLALNLAVNLLNREASETYTYEWKLNDAVVSGATGSSLNQTLNKAGTNMIHVKVTNSKGSGVLERSYILNTLPKLTLTLSTDSAVAGKAITAIAAPSDPDAGTRFSFVWKLQRPGTTAWIAIPGLAKQPSFAAFELPTASLAMGAYKLQVTVSDGMGGSVAVDDTFDVTANGLPIVGEIQLPFDLVDKGVLQANSPTPVSKLGTFGITANDPDGGPLTYTWRVNGRVVSKKPTPNVIIDLGIPTAVNPGDPGVRVISVEVEDPQGGKVVKTITVRVNHLPTATISIGAQTDSRTAPVSSTVRDMDTGDTFTYVWKLQRSGETTWTDIPGMSTQPTTASFDLPVGSLVTGAYKLQLKVTDNNGGSATAEKNASFVVNEAPTVRVASAKVGANTVVTATANDPDGDALTYSWKMRKQDASEWGDIPDMNPQPTSTSFTLPSSIKRGAYEVQVTVNDGIANGTAKADLIVANRAAEVSVSSETKDNGDIDVTAVASDPDGDTLSYSWRIRKKGTTATAWAAVEGNPTTQKITLSPNRQKGTYEVQVTVRDSGGGSTAKQTDVTIPNNAPTVTVSSATNAARNIVVTATAKDIDGDALTYVWKIREKDTGAWLDISGLSPQPSGASFTLPASYSSGSYEVQVTVNDGVVSKVAQTGISVLNRAPTAVVSSVVNSAGEIVVTATASDLDGDTLTYSWRIRQKDTNAWAAIEGNPVTRSFTLPASIRRGNYEVQVTVNDGIANGKAKADLIVANRAAEVSVTSETRDDGNIVVTAIADDPDGDALSYVWKISEEDTNAWLNIPDMDPQPTGSSFTLPASLGKGTYEVRVTVGDSGGGSTAKQTNVLVANHAPTATVAAVTNAAGITVTATAKDIDGDTLTYSWKIRSKVNGATWSAVTGNPSTASFVLPTQYSSGEYWVQVTVNDGTTTGTGQGSVGILNRAPTVTLSGESNSDGDLVLTAVASDPDGDTLSYSWRIRNKGTTTGWATVEGNPTTKVITLPESVRRGTYEVEVTVNDGTTTKTAKTDATVANRAAEVSVTSETRDNGNIVVTAIANDPDGDALSYVWKISEEDTSTWLNIPDMNPQPTGTSFTLPASIGKGTYEVRVTVGDSGGGSTAKQTNVLVANHAPTATVASVTNAAGITVTAKANDIDGDTLTYSWKIRSKVGSATWSAVTGNPSTASFVLPAAYTSGEYWVEVTVNDGTTTGTGRAGIGILNRAPTVSVSAVTNAAGTTVTAVASDPDGDTLSYSWRIRKKGTTTGWATVEGNPTTKVITLPESVRRGTYEVEVTVNDGTTTKTAKTDATVANRAAEVSVTSETRDDGNLVVTAIANDPDGDALSYVWKISEEDTSAWLNIPDMNPQPTGTSFTLPASVAKGTYEVRVTVGDSGGGSTAKQTNVLVANHAPTATVAAVTNAAGITVTATAKDIDGDTLTYSWKIRSKVNGATWSAVTGNPSTASFVLPTQYSSGEYWVQVTVNDGTTTGTGRVGIGILNRAPTVTLSGESNSDGDLVLTAVASDPDGDTLSYSWRIRNKGTTATAWTAVEGNPTTASITLPATTRRGEYEVEVRVSDGTDIKSAQANVTVENHAPDVTLSADTQTNGNVVLTTVATDLDNDALTYSWEMRLKGDDTWGPVAGNPTTAIITLLSSGFVKGTYEIRVTVKDGQGGSTLGLLNLIVPNHAPTVTVASVTNAKGITVTATAKDIDGDTLTYSWKIRSKVGSVMWSAVAGNPTTASITLPTQYSSGDYWVQVTVSDGTESISRQTSVEVLATNQAPVVSLSSTKNANGDVVVTATASDPDGDALTYSWKMRKQDASDWADIPGLSSQPEGTSFTVPASVADGNYEVQVTVGDGTVSVIRETGIVITSAANRPPKVDLSSVTSGGRVTVRATASDPDGDTLSYVWKLQRPEESTWIDIPGMNPQPSGYSFTLPASLADGTYGIQVTVSDGKDSVTKEDDVIISATTNQAPTVYITTARSGSDTVVTAHATDPEGDTLRYTWQMRYKGSDKWNDIQDMEPQPTGREFTLPSSIGEGNYEIQVKVDDGSNTASAEYALTVDKGNQKPVVVDLSASGRTVTAKAVDPEGDPLTYSWSVRTPGSKYFDPFILGEDLQIIEPQPTGTSFTLPMNYAADGIYRIRVMVDDGNNIVFDHIDIRLSGTNRVPVMHEVSSAKNGGDTIVTAKASDPDGDALTYTWQMRLQGTTKWGKIVGFSPQPRTASFVLPTNIPTGTYEIQVKANDGISDSGTAKTSVTLSTGSGRPILSLNLGNIDSGYVPAQAHVRNASIGVTYDRFEWAFKRPSSNSWGPPESDRYPIQYLALGEVSIPLTIFSDFNQLDGEAGDYLVRVTAIGSDGSTLTAEGRLLTVVHFNVGGTLKNFVWEITWESEEYATGYKVYWDSAPEYSTSEELRERLRPNTIEVGPDVTRYPGPIPEDSVYSSYHVMPLTDRPRHLFLTNKSTLVGRYEIVRNND